MYKWFSLLSSRQRVEMAAAILLSAIIIGIGVFTSPAEEETVSQTFTVDMSIRDIAPVLDVTGKGLARELELPLDTPKQRPLKQAGISQEQLDHAVEHIVSHHSTNLKYYIFAVIAFCGLVYLTRLGRPDNAEADIAGRKLWYNRTPYLICLVAAVIFCGFVLGKSPNPMEGVVKVFKSMVGLYPSVIDKVVSLAFFIALAVIGNKIICGWACPFGALQELIYSLPLFRKIKRYKTLFWVTNTVRVGLFVIALLLLFGIVGGSEGFVIYHYLNPFNLFDLSFENWLILLSVIVFLVLAFVMYRPFCRFICPFGFVSWIAEKFSLYRVRIDKNKCTKCGACVEACPSNATKGKIEGNLLPADCFSCARCLTVCPVDAIHYCSVWSGRKAGEDGLKNKNSRNDL